MRRCLGLLKGAVTAQKTLQRLETKARELLEGKMITISFLIKFFYKKQTRWNVSGQTWFTPASRYKKRSPLAPLSHPTPQQTLKSNSNKHHPGYTSPLSNNLWINSNVKLYLPYLKAVDRIPFGVGGSLSKLSCLQGGSWRGVSMPGPFSPDPLIQQHHTGMLIDIWFKILLGNTRG